MNIPIKDVENLADKCGCDMAIVIGFDLKAGTFQVTSHGRTLTLCRVAKGLNEQIHKLITVGAIEPNP